MLQMCFEINRSKKFKEREKNKREGILPEDFTRGIVTDSFHQGDSEDMHPETGKTTSLH